MRRDSMNVAILGLSISSSWGNGHATTYRGLVRALGRRGHRVLFLERDVEWYARHRDAREPEGCRLVLYRSLEELRSRYRSALTQADVVVVGSYVPDGTAVAEFALESARGVVAFYDIDTPVTLAALEDGTCAYLTPELVARFDLYLSFTGGPTLRRLEGTFGARRAVPLYCSVDPRRYAPVQVRTVWDLGYLGTYSADRQPGLEALLLAAARARRDLRFVVAGPQYPPGIDWPSNVRRIEHVEPDAHASFYSSQRFTLNLTRAAMVRAGYSPSVRLFEAAACGVPIVSDPWPGLDEFFEPGREILIAREAGDVLECLEGMGEVRRREIGLAARSRILERHTAAHRALEFEIYAREALGRRPAAALGGRS